MVNQLSAAAATTSTGGASSTSAQAAAALMRFGGINTERAQDTDDPLREEDGQMSIEIAEKILKWHAEATGRCVELTPTNDVQVFLPFDMFHSPTNMTVQRTHLLSFACWQKLSGMAT
jgi:hypothetical protein